MNFRNPVVAVWTFAIYTAIGVFFALHQHLDDLIFNPSMHLNERFLYELSGAWSAMLMLPFLNAVVRRFPVTRKTIPAAILANLAGYVIYTLGHTTINDFFRFALAPIFGVSGEQIFGFFRELPSEAANDIVYYGMVVATLYLINRFLEMQEISKKLAEARLENLRLQLQPHFLFNTLNAISSVMYEDVAKADSMLAKVSEFMRYVLDSSGVQSVNLDEELRVERMYVDIMKTRLERNLMLTIDVDDEAREAMVPFMLLQPLLENSIRHGMGSTRSSIDLAVGVARSNGSTIIRVTDDGVGYAPGATHGIGLSNVASRLEYMYGDRASFAIEPLTGGGTVATLRFPYTEGSR